MHSNSTAPELHVRHHFPAQPLPPAHAMLLSHYLSERQKNLSTTEQAVFVPVYVCQTNKIISCIRKYDKYNLRTLDQREAKP